MIEDKDNTYKNMLIFYMIWTGLIFMVLPLLDILILNHFIQKSFCEYGFIMPIEENIERCNELIGEKE